MKEEVEEEEEDGRRSVVTYCCPSLNELTEMSPHLTPLVLGANYFDCKTLKRSPDEACVHNL